MSTRNIQSIVPVLAGYVPVGVTVTFQCHGGKTLTYFYDAVEAIKGILQGEDPSQWVGVRVEEGNAPTSGGLDGEVGSDVAEIGTIGEL